MRAPETGLFHVYMHPTTHVIAELGEEFPEGIRQVSERTSHSAVAHADLNPLNSWLPPRCAHPQYSEDDLEWEFIGSSATFGA